MWLGLGRITARSCSEAPTVRPLSIRRSSAPNMSSSEPRGFARRLKRMRELGGGGEGAAAAQTVAVRRGVWRRHCTVALRKQ